MKSIDFPGDGPLHKTELLPVYLEYGEILRITFSDGGDFSQINKYAFTRPLPEGFFGETVDDDGIRRCSVLISAPAANSKQTTVLKFIDDDDGREIRHTIIVNATGQPPAPTQAGDRDCQ